MNQITELPEWTDYGHDFNYAQWTASTQVSLHNVSWDNSYRDIVRFDNGQDELNQYLDRQSGPVINIPQVTYHRPGHTIKLQIPHGLAIQFNYLRAYNPPQPGQPEDVGRYYYYFISGVNHINPSTSEFQLQLDVIQSYIYDVEFGNCYISQGHIGIANSRAFEDNGREFLTIPEGLDIGSEYEIKYVYSRQIASARNNSDGYSILVISTVSLKQEPGEPGNINLQSATGNGLENLPNGTEAYVFQGKEDWFKFLEAYKDKTWITQGVISITAIPPNLAVMYGMKAKTTVVNGVTFKEVQDGQLKTLKFTLAENWRQLIRGMLPQRYKHLDKLMVYPYTVLEMTAHTGTPLVLKPESMPGENMDVVEVPHFAQPGPRIMFYPFRYNAGPNYQVLEDANGIMNDGGEFLDMATGIFNFPTFSLTNNGYMSFMGANAAGINYQHQSADWSQSRALAGNQLGFNQASAGIGLSQDLTNIGIDASRQSTTLGQQTAIMQGGLSALNGALGAGNPAGAIGAVANAVAGTAIGINQSEQQFGINANQARRSNAANTGNMGYIRDSNKDYADMATRGDYQNSVAGINAKVQDAKAIQPTTSGQVGGDAFLLAQYRWGYDVKVKTIQAAAMSRMGEYWLRYGYSVQRFGTMPKNLKVMTSFTYWKLMETYIISARCPESFKNTIRGIFEKGVTVWTYPDEIGRIDIAANRPLKGISL